MDEIKRKPANTSARPPATRQSRWLARAPLSLILAVTLAALYGVGKSPAHAAAPPSPLHCWTGGEGLTTSEAGKTVPERTLEKAAASMEKTAPPGADTTSWEY